MRRQLPVRKFSLLVLLNKVGTQSKVIGKFAFIGNVLRKIVKCFSTAFFLRVLQNFTTKKGRVALFIVAFFCF